jgi:hypothetical protein
MVAGALRAVLGSIRERLVKDLLMSYRPEKYYMRGPGPKCSEKKIANLIWADNRPGVHLQSRGAPQRTRAPQDK